MNARSRSVYIATQYDGEMEEYELLLAVSQSLETPHAVFQSEIVWKQWDME